MGPVEREGARGAAAGDGDRHFVGHARTVMALTLVSRVSGMGRDAVCSRVFGSSPVWSAFVIAFMVPNLLRRLFGEGAISAAFIPEYAQAVKRDPALADRFASMTAAVVFAGLGVVVVVLEGVLAVVHSLLEGSDAATGGEGASARDVVVFAMVMLPFAPLVCSTAMLGGMLQAHDRYVPHAASPILLNVCMIGAAAGFSFGFGADAWATALALSAGVLAAGVLQMAWCVWSLRGIVRWTRTAEGVGEMTRRMLRRLAPVLIGMGTLQLGVVIDGLIAGWPLLVGPTLGFGIAYPLDDGAAGLLFYANRLYQFPLGVFGIAIATALFPALSRQADEPGEFSATLRRGIRASVFIGVPATVGLLLVARDASAVIFLGGAFGAEELERVTRALLAYAPAIWAYSLTHVLTRSFYARGDTLVPMRVGIATVSANVALNLTLMWWLAEAGLALATSIAATGQCVALSVVAGRRIGHEGRALLDRETVRAIAWCVGAAGAMTGAVLVGRLVPMGVEGWWGHAAALARDVGIGAVAYLGLAAVLHRPELGWMLERRAGHKARDT